jgi:hypothetical protein
VIKAWDGEAADHARHDQDASIAISAPRGARVRWRTRAALTANPESEKERNIRGLRARTPGRSCFVVWLDGPGQGSRPILKLEWDALKSFRCSSHNDALLVLATAAFMPFRSESAHDQRQTQSSPRESPFRLPVVRSVGNDRGSPRGFQCDRLLYREPPDYAVGWGNRRHRTDPLDQGTAPSFWRGRPAGARSWV